MKHIFTLLAFSLFFNARAQQANEKFFDNWKGSLKLPGTSLDLIFKISSETGKIITKLDVPAQHATDLPANKTEIIEDSLFIDFAMMHASFKGFFNNDSSMINGFWKQNNIRLPLKLLRSNEKITEVKHPQEPQKPYPYNEEELIFENEKASLKLAGTLTWPKNKSNCPVVVLVSGSGPQNRNEELLGQKPFLVVADYLTRQGIAVLRYDDRGVGESTGDFQNSTTFDFASDAEAALRYLKTRKEFDKKKIGIIGHSEGGLIASMIASHSKDVAFIVLMAAPGLKGVDLMALQAATMAQLAGMPDSLIAKTTVINKKIYNLAIKNFPYASDSIISLLENIGMPLATAKMQSKTVLSLWYRNFLAIDPAKYLEKISCSVLAINGEKDVQVVYPQNLEAVEKSLIKNKDHKIIAYEDLNHLFQHCKTGSVDEYASIEETLSVQVLKDLSDWILKLK